VAKAGVASGVTAGGSQRSAGTRRQLVQAAIETLSSEGFAGASARTIADRAGLNQGLIFYHFGSVANLLLAALDAVSEERLQLYGAEVSTVSGPRQLVDAAERMFRSDFDAGYVTVLVEMIAGASSTPGLGAEVASRIAPWKDFARSTIEASLRGTPLDGVLPIGDLAHAVVALYLGLEMLGHLGGDPGPAFDLFSHAKQLASLVENLIPPNAPKEPA
jgi:AcrR family transcriptional regulator